MKIDGVWQSNANRAIDSILTPKWTFQQNMAAVMEQSFRDSLSTGEHNGEANISNFLSS
jgi:hypothetical protein